jgi:hypothetical protein
MHNLQCQQRIAQRVILRRFSQLTKTKDQHVHYSPTCMSNENTKPNSTGYPLTLRSLQSIHYETLGMWNDLSNSEIVHSALLSGYLYRGLGCLLPTTIINSSVTSYRNDM